MEPSHTPNGIVNDAATSEESGSSSKTQSYYLTQQLHSLVYTQEK